MQTWRQLEFDFTDDSPAKRKNVDYEELYRILQTRPLSFKEIMQITGLSKSATAQCITTLTLRYPIWNPERGVYKLCKEEDYQTVDWSKLDVE